MNVQTILLVEDEPHIATMLREILERAGYSVAVAYDAFEAVGLVERQSYDAFLVDLRLPGASGLAVVERARELNPECAILMISGNAKMNNVIEALQFRIDDFLLKPVSEEKLIASVGRALINRRRRLVQTQVMPMASDLMLGPLCMNAEQRTAYWHGQLLTLTPTEFCILLLLAQHHGQAVSPVMLVQRCRGYSTTEEEARFLLKPHIANLRGKLEQRNRYQRVILNHRGVGFALRIPHASQMPNR